MPRDKANTNSKIIQCMKEEFLTCGYEKTSLNRVSAKVGITTAGLDKHFESKEDTRKPLQEDVEGIDDSKEIATTFTFVKR